MNSFAISFDYYCDNLIHNVKQWFDDNINFRYSQSWLTENKVNWMIQHMEYKLEAPQEFHHLIPHPCSLLLTYYRARKL